MTMILGTITESPRQVRTGFFFSVSDSNVRMFRSSRHQKSPTPRGVGSPGVGAEKSSGPG